MNERPAGGADRGGVLVVRDLWAAPRGAPPERESVLCGVEFELAAGEKAHLLGPNGSGKSTLAHALAGLLKPRQGEVFVEGLGPRGDGFGGVGLVFQDPDSQMVTVSVERELALGLQFLGLPRGVVREKVERALRRFHLEELRSRAPERLSGGEKQRVALAAVTILNPKALVLDEVTAYLDGRGCEDLERALSHLAAGMPVLSIGSRTSEPPRGETVHVMVEGRIAASGPAEEILVRGGELARVGLELPPLLRLRDELVGRGVLLPHDMPPLPTVKEMAQAVHMRSGVRESNREGAGRAGSEVEVPRGPSPGGASLGAGASRGPTGGDGAAARASSAPHRMDTGLTAGGVRVVYERGMPTETTALAGAELSLRSGELLGLLGESGSGKSTLLAAMSGIIRPDGGCVALEGRALGSRETRGRVGILFQFAEDQMVADTLVEDVAYGPRRMGLDRSRARSRAEEVLAGVGLGEDLHLRPLHALSFGEKRLAALAGVLALEPEFLLLDEPTAGLDPAGRRTVSLLLSRLVADGCGVLLATHDVELVGELAHRVAVMHRGKIVFNGSVASFIEKTVGSERWGLPRTSLSRLLEELNGMGIAACPRRLTPAGVAEALAVGVGCA